MIPLMWVPASVRPVVALLLSMIDLVPVVRALLEGIQAGDQTAAKRALYKLEAEAAERALVIARGGPA